METAPATAFAMTGVTLVVVGASFSTGFEQATAATVNVVTRV
jgi:hypothetical protein